MQVPEHLDTSALPLAGAATHTQEEEDALDQTLDKLRNRLQQAGYVNSAMTSRMQASPLQGHLAHKKTPPPRTTIGP